jgi:hypothetical protein
MSTCVEDDRFDRIDLVVSARHRGRRILCGYDDFKIFWLNTCCIECGERGRSDTFFG